MLAYVRDFAKTERELVERDAVNGQVYPPVKGHELSEANVTIDQGCNANEILKDRYSTPKRLTFHTLQYGNIFGTCSYK